MAELNIPPCPDNWSRCDFCGAGPEEGCRNPDYQGETRMAIGADLGNAYKNVPCVACHTPALCKDIGYAGCAGPRKTPEMAASRLSGKIVKANLAAKETNPKDAAGAPKVSVSLVPEVAIIELSQAFRDGAAKYTPFNWRRAPVRYSVYIDAMERHLMLLRAGQDKASDSGLHHATHIMSGCAIILDAMLHDTLIDDRHKLEAVETLERLLEEYRQKNANNAA